VLASAKVNLEALSLSDGVHTGVLKIVVDDPAAARTALEQGGLQFYEQPILAVALPNQPGALAELCRELAEDGFSIDYVYGSTCRCPGDHDRDCQSELMVSVADLKAVETLERAGLWPGP
jgi:hypothetical protein